jgi:hypothetical protein
MNVPTTKAQSEEVGASLRVQVHRPGPSSANRVGRHFRRRGSGSSPSASAPSWLDHQSRLTEEAPVPLSDHGGPLSDQGAALSDQGGALLSGEEGSAGTDDLVQYHLDLLNARIAEMKETGSEGGCVEPFGGGTVWRIPAASDQGDSEALADLLQANKRLRSHT